MKTAIPTNDKVTVSPVFGRAQFFALYDQNGDLEFIDNSENATLPGGAGVNTSQNLLKHEVTRIITIDFGPKAKDVFKDTNVEIVYLKETASIADIMKEYAQ